MLNPHYVAGFVDGEGCFCVTISRRRFRLPEVRLKFEIELREDDEPILERIRQMLKCGYIYHFSYEKTSSKWRPHVKYQVSSFKDVREKVIPFFKKYPLQAKKKKQFEFFCLISELVNNNEHKTIEGVEKIRSLREVFRHEDSLDARDGHVQWGAEGFLPQSPPIKPAKSAVPDTSVFRDEGKVGDEG